MLAKIVIFSIVICIIAVLYFFLPYKPINKYKSDNYYFNFLKTQVHYIPTGNSFELGNYKMKDIDLKSVEILANDYLKDKSNVYYKYKMIKNADPGSIKILSSKSYYSFAVDKNMIYYEGHAFRDIDIKSVQFFGDSCGPVLKDKTHVYSTFGVNYNTEDEYVIPPLKNVHPATYQSLNNFYGKDEKTAYYKGEPIPSSDPKTFILLGDYAKDANTVYFDGLPVTGVDPETISHVDGGDYFKDKNGVYYGLNTVEDAEGNALSYSVRIVAGADPETFVMIKSEKIDYARDKNRFYWGGKAE